MNKRKSLTDIRLITGFFREAHFQNLSVSYLHKSVEASAKIIEIKENNARSKTERRILVLSLNQSFGPEVSEIIQFKCAFSQFVALWEGEIISTEENLEISIPNELKIQNHRGTNRRTHTGEKIQVPLLVQTGNVHAVEYLEIEDYSKFGIGGSITGSSGIPFTPETIVSGEWHSNTGSIKIHGKVTQVRLIEQSNTLGPIKYRIGISLAPKPTVRPANLSKEESHRKFTRFRTERRLSFTSPINPNYQIAIDLIDVSNAGFAARLKDNGDMSLLILGGTLRLKDSSILAELVSSVEGLLRFQIVAGSSEDRIKWLREIVTPTQKNIHTSVSNGLDIIDLFCEAGALSNQYIKNQNRLADNFQKELSTDGTEDSWIHRWIEKDKFGKVNGHICSVRISDHCWHMGEIAGSLDTERKISAGFVPDFFSGFKEYCLATSPCPRVLIGWNEGHPYWREWEEQLQKKVGEISFFKLKTNYFRYPNTLTEVNTEEASFQIVDPKDWKFIEKISRSIASEKIRELISVFDFSKENFSSPYLKKLVSEANLVFRREYVVFTLRKDSYLVIYNSFPLKASLNQTLNVPWIFPMGEANSLPPQVSPLVEKIRLVGAQLGFSFPGLLEVMGDKSHVTSATGKKMIWYFGHPEILASLKGVK